MRKRLSKQTKNYLPKQGSRTQRTHENVRHEDNEGTKSK